MQHVIELLERHLAYHRDFPRRDLMVNELTVPRHTSCVTEFAKALSILRSYPEAGEDEPEGYKIGASTPIAVEKLDGMFTTEQAEQFVKGIIGPDENATDEPIAPVFTPPPMEDDPRYLKLVVACLVAALQGATSTDWLVQTVGSDAKNLYEALFPKP